MAHIIIVVVLVLLIMGGGYLWIKRKLRLQKKQQDLAWRISQGDVSEEPEVENRRQWWGMFKALPSVPPHLMLPLSQLPEFTDRLLQLYKPYADNIPLVFESSRRYQASMNELPHMSVSDLPAFAAWWSQSLPRVVANRRNGGEFCLRYKTHFAAHDPIESATADLKNLLETIEQHGLRGLPPAEMLAVDLAKRVLAAASLRKSFDLSVSAPSDSTEASVPHAEAEAACRQLLPMLQRSVAQIVPLLGCLAAAEKAKEALANIVAEPQLPDPQRPSAADVQAWLLALDQWAARKRDLEQAFSRRLAALKSAWQVERDDTVSCTLQKLKHWHAEFGMVTDYDEHLIRPWFVSNEAEAMHSLAKDVDGRCRSVVNQAEQFLASETAASNSEFLRVPLSETDEKRRAYVMSAVRKLGFAVAQRNAVEEKFKNAEEEANSKPARPALCLEAANADAFVAAYKRWCEAVKRHDQACTDRSGRVGELRKQRDERSQQVQTAVAAVAAALSKPLSGDLAEVLSIALAVESKYKVVPPPRDERRYSSRCGSGSSCGSSYSSSCGGSSF